MRESPLVVRGSRRCTSAGPSGPARARGRDGRERGPDARAAFARGRASRTNLDPVAVHGLGAQCRPDRTLSPRLSPSSQRRRRNCPWPAPTSRTNLILAAGVEERRDDALCVRLEYRRIRLIVLVACAVAQKLVTEGQVRNEPARPAAREHQIAPGDGARRPGCVGGDVLVHGDAQTPRKDEDVRALAEQARPHGDVPAAVAGGLAGGFALGRGVPFDVFGH